jgi:hypothetical protein
LTIHLSEQNPIACLHFAWSHIIPHLIKSSVGQSQSQSQMHEREEGTYLLILTIAMDLMQLNKQAYLLRKGPQVLTSISRYFLAVKRYRKVLINR